MTQIPRRRSFTFSLAILGLIGTACPGGGASTESTTGSSGAATTVDSPPTSTSGTSTGPSGMSTGEGTTGEGTTGPICTGPHLLSRWVVPDQDFGYGVGMDDSGAVTFLGGSHNTDAEHASLVRIVDGEVAWSLIHAPAFKFVSPNGLAVRGDGVALVVGYSSDPTKGSFEKLPWAAAYDAEGTLLFDDVKVADADACDDPPCRKGQNRAAVVTAGGQFLVAGEQGSYIDLGFVVSGVLRRYDAKGEVAVTTFPTPNAAFTDRATSLALRSDGSVVMFGDTDNIFKAGKGYDWWFARLAADGSFQAINTLSVAYDDLAGGIVVLDDGSIVFTAETKNPLEDGDVFAGRLDPGLASVWQVLGTNMGPIVLGADDATYQLLDDEQIVEKLSSAGKRMWQDDPCLASDYSADSLALSPDGTKLIVGRSHNLETVVEIYDAI